MKFLLFVEGHTERPAVPAFLKRWLDPQLKQPVGIQPVRFEGCAEFLDGVKKKAHMRLDGSGSQDVIAVVGLLDLYGLPDCLEHEGTVTERLDWATEHIESLVEREKFHQFFAVHEVEAWLLSQPDVFPSDVRKILPAKIKVPEEVNFDEPPAYLLSRLYKQATRKKYKKVTYGRNLFEKLDPNNAYEKCPQLKNLLDTMLGLAKGAGL